MDMMISAIATEDLLPPDVYAGVRPDYRRRIIELKNRRRVMIGPHISVVFESRETALYQIQEMLWLERMTNSTRIALEIAEYEQLVPRASELTATLMIHSGSWEAGRILLESLFSATSVLYLCIDQRMIAAEPISPSGDAACPVQYLRFPLDFEALDRLRNRCPNVRLGAMYDGKFEVVPLASVTIDELALDLRANRAPPGVDCLPYIQNETNSAEKDSR